MRITSEALTMVLNSNLKCGVDGGGRDSKSNVLRAESADSVRKICLRHHHMVSS